jgi:hypothetical protein
MAEEPILDPTSAAIIAERRLRYLQLRDEAKGREKRLHFHLMAGFSEVSGKAMVTEAVGMDWDEIFRAYFACSTKLAAEAIVMCSKDNGEQVNEEALAEAFVTAVRAAIGKRTPAGEIQVGHG